MVWKKTLSLYLVLSIVLSLLSPGLAANAESPSADANATTQVSLNPTTVTTGDNQEAGDPNPANSDSNATNPKKSDDVQALPSGDESSQAPVTTDETKSDDDATAPTTTPTTTDDATEPTTEDTTTTTTTTTTATSTEQDQSATPSDEAQIPAIIEDAQLANLLKLAVGKVADDILTVADLETLTELKIDNTFGGIESLSGLEQAKNLEILLIENVEITDLAPISTIETLKTLTLKNLPMLTSIDTLVLSQNLETLELGGLPIDLENSPTLTTLIDRGVTVTILDLTEELLLQAYKVTEATAQISWSMYNSEAFDNYKLYLNGTLVETLPNDQYEYQLTELDPEMDYQVKVEVTKGDTVLAEKEITFTTLADPTGDEVVFASDDLKKAVQEELGLTRTVYESDMLNLTSLYIPGLYVESLVGLETATNLAQLDLTDNYITDLSPLANLQNLVILNLGGNPIPDFSVLKEMPNLSYLDVSNTMVKDIQFLTELENLSFVSLYGNLHLAEDASALQVIEALIAKGVEVQTGFDEDTNMVLYTNYINESKISLGWEYFSMYSPDEVDHFKLTVNGEEVELSEEEMFGKVLTDLTPKTSYDIKIKAYNADNVLMGQASLPVETTDLPTGEVVTFADVDLEQAVKDALGLERPVQVSDMERLEVLDLMDKGISDLTGLEYAKNLVIVSLYGNLVTDVTPLANLQNLLMIDLGNNPISDIAPLQTLQNLMLLELSMTKVKDYSALGNIPTLALLGASGNELTSFESFSTITSLQLLDVSGNSLKNFNGIEKMTGLQSLYAIMNPIEDFSSLKSTSLVEAILVDTNMTNLDWVTGTPNMQFLAVDGNPIESFNVTGANLVYFSASSTGMDNLDWVANTPNLELLSIDNNPIKDLKPLGQLKKLTILSASYLEIDNIDVLLDLPSLQDVYIQYNSNLDISEGSQAYQVIQTLLERGVFVMYLPDPITLWDATSGEDYIHVAWGYPEDSKITEVRLYLNGEEVTTLPAEQTYYSFEGLEANTDYEVMIEAWEGDEPVAGMMIMIATTPNDLVDITNVVATDDSVQVDWAYGGEERIAWYDVMIESEDGEYYAGDNFSPETLSYLFEGLEPNTNYKVTVRAFSLYEEPIGQAMAKVTTKATGDGENPDNPGGGETPGGDNGGSTPGTTPGAGTGTGTGTGGGKVTTPTTTTPVVATTTTTVKKATGNLPDTATNMYNILAVGVALLLLGGVSLFVARKRKEA